MTATELQSDLTACRQSVDHFSRVADQLAGELKRAQDEITTLRAMIHSGRLLISAHLGNLTGLIGCHDICDRDGEFRGCLPGQCDRETAQERCRQWIGRADAMNRKD